MTRIDCHDIVVISKKHMLCKQQNVCGNKKDSNKEQNLRDHYKLRLRLENDMEPAGFEPAIA